MSPTHADLNVDVRPAALKTAAAFAGVVVRLYPQNVFTKGYCPRTEVSDTELIRCLTPSYEPNPLFRLIFDLACALAGFPGGFVDDFLCAFLHRASGFLCGVFGSAACVLCGVGGF